MTAGAARVTLPAGLGGPGALPGAAPARSLAPALVVALPALALQGSRSVLWSLVGLALLLAYVLRFERRVLRRLGRLRFWVVSLAVALLSGLLLGEKTMRLAGMETTVTLEQAIRAAATPREDGRQVLDCAHALALAREHGVEPKRVAQLCDDADVRIVHCQLGCFA